jgi:hypothetical protein
VQFKGTGVGSLEIYMTTVGALAGKGSSHSTGQLFFALGFCSLLC